MRLALNIESKRSWWIRVLSSLFLGLRYWVGKDVSSRGVAIVEALKSAYLSGYAASPQRVSINIACSRVWYQVTKKAISAHTPFDHSNFVAGSVQVYLMLGPEVPSDEDDSREIFWVEYPIQVGIAAYLKTTSPADIDPLAQLSQELRDYTLQLDPAYSLGIPEGLEKVPEVLVDPDYDAIQTDKLFLSVFTLSFKGARSRWSLN